VSVLRAAVKEPTDRELEVLEFMRSFQREHGMPPTAREVCKAFGFSSTNSAVEYFKRLENKGLVMHRPRIARGWIPRSPLSTGEVQ
jgi:repressor LexA